MQICRCGSRHENLCSHEKKTLHDDDYRGVVTRWLFPSTVHRRKPKTIHATNEIHDKCDNFHHVMQTTAKISLFFNLLELKPFWPQFGSSFLGNNSIDGCQKMVLTMRCRRDAFASHEKWASDASDAVLSWCCTVKPSQPSIAVKLRHDGSAASAAKPALAIPLVLLAEKRGESGRSLKLCCCCCLLQNSSLATLRT